MDCPRAIFRARFAFLCNRSTLALLAAAQSVGAFTKPSRQMARSWPRASESKFTSSMSPPKPSMSRNAKSRLLTRMKLEGVESDDVLKEAQRRGYAEAEPSLDIDGHDSLHKIGILASLAHGFWVHPKEIHAEGIRPIKRVDIHFASQLGYTIK